MIKILFIEDNEDLAFTITETLSVLGNYKVISAFNGKDGVDLFLKEKPHIVISDIDMPFFNGFKVAEFIRDIDKECLIFLATGLSSTKDILKGYEIGIDEYIKKPYTALELHARIQALLRRLNISFQASENNATTMFSIGKYQLDSNKKLLIFDTEIIKLTPREFGVLKLLAENKNKLVTKETLIASLWEKNDGCASRSLDVFISKLRKHLSKDKKVKITSKRGVGISLIEK